MGWIGKKQPNERRSTRKQMTARYAVYYSPSDQSELAGFGEAILRRTAVQIPELDDGIGQERRRMLKRPRHYGFHATLKAPFELANGTTVEKLGDAVQALSVTLETIPLAGLRICSFNGFAALAFERQPESCAFLARRSVLELEPFRAPLSEEDYLRRNPDQLSDRQRGFLKEFGYHHILDDFDFHMTLSGELPPDPTRFLAWLDQEFRRMVSDVPLLDRLALFMQPDRESPFTRIAEYPFPAVSEQRDAAASRR